MNRRCKKNSSGLCWLEGGPATSGQPGGLQPWRLLRQRDRAGCRCSAAAHSRKQQRRNSGWTLRSPEFRLPPLLPRVLGRALRPAPVCALSHLWCWWPSRECRSCPQTAGRAQSRRSAGQWLTQLHRTCSTTSHWPLRQQFEQAAAAQCVSVRCLSSQSLVAQAKPSKTCCPQPVTHRCVHRGRLRRQLQKSASPCPLQGC